ncbi:MAG: methyltransferase domain-containing protein [Pseudomonadota bacterium]
MTKEENALDHYVLAHGSAGRARLNVLARVMEAGTESLLKRVGIEAGAACLDVGCGGGDVSLLLARHVGADGSVVGVDLDEAKLESARQEAGEAGLGQVSYRTASVFDLAPDESFDIVYSRFLLTHLADPAGAIEAMLGALRPGGRLVLEDIDFSGHFAFPDFPALWDYVRLYSAAVATTGGDANIGPRLPGLLKASGLAEVGMQVSQPAALSGDAKLITPITMESIGQRVIEAGLATAEEVRRIAKELTKAANDPTVVMGTPRIVQTWGRKPS